MNRREMLGVIGAGGLALMAGKNAFAQEAGERERRGPEGRRHEEHRHEEHRREGHGDIHRRCAEACADCMKECNEGFHHCFEQVASGRREHAPAMHLLADCGEFCATSAKLVARMSPLMVHSCAACAEACDATLAVCEKLRDPEMAHVVDSLRKCSASCHEMVRSMGGHGLSHRPEHGHGPDRERDHVIDRR